MPSGKKKKTAVQVPQVSAETHAADNRLTYHQMEEVCDWVANHMSNHPPKLIHHTLQDSTLVRIPETIYDTTLRKAKKNILASLDRTHELAQAFQEAGNNSVRVAEVCQRMMKDNDLGAKVMEEFDNLVKEWHCKEEKKKVSGKRRETAMRPLIMGDVSNMSENIQDLHPELPRKMAFCVGPLPIRVMEMLCLHYGSIGARKRFQTKSSPISSSEFDVEYTKKKNTDVRFDRPHGQKVATINSLVEKQMENGLNQYTGPKSEDDVVKGGGDLLKLETPPSFNGTMKQNTMEYYLKVGLDPWFLRNCITHYLMDLEGLTKNPNTPNKKITHSQAHAAGLCSVDSKYMTDMGCDALKQLMVVVAEALNQVLGTRNIGRKPWIIRQYGEEETGNDREMTMHSGVITTGAVPVHQDLHIDNKHIIDKADKETFKAIQGLDLHQASETFITNGYVVDVPLTREGSWLRVALPKADRKTFEMDWVHVPFGNAMVRSMLLFHGGHYGTPGNTRFHCTYTLAGNEVADKDLGYIQYLGQGKAGETFGNWKLQWKPGKCRDPHKPDPSGKLAEQNAKNEAAKYYNRIRNPALYTQGPLLIALANLSPCEMDKRTTTTFAGEEEGMDDEGGDNGATSSKPPARASKRKRKAS